MTLRLMRQMHLNEGETRKCAMGDFFFRSRRLGLEVSSPFCVEKWSSQNEVCTVIIRRLSATTKQQAFWRFICLAAGSTLSILYRSDVDIVVGWGGWKTWSRGSCGSAKHRWGHLAHSCFGLVWIHAIAVLFFFLFVFNWWTMCVRICSLEKKRRKKKQ